MAGNGARQRKVMIALIWLLCSADLLHPAPKPDTAHEQAKAARALRIYSQINLDGSLDESVWGEAPANSGFLQKEPREGEPATEQTEFKVLYNEKSVYFGIICFDSDPAQIKATELRRDNDLEKDDSIAIILDTFHDHRNAFLFKTNPLGTQFDALITEEGRDVNSNWDETWRVEARITEFGWVVEIEIPFKTLRVKQNGQQVWGLDLQRIIRRKNEFTFWNSYRRNFKFEQVSQAGHLLGVEKIEAGFRLRVKPFVVAGISRTEVGRDPGTDNLTEVGLETAKYRITPSLTADFTFNTDFAQTDVDDQRVNLTQFPLFFPEKREFFLENAGIFRLNAELGEHPGSRDLVLFFSRRIGLSERGEPIPILGGARVTGRAGAFTLGLLNIQTERQGELPGSNFSVFRIKRDILSRSTIGALFTNRQSKQDNDFNRLYALDTNFVFFKNLNVQSFIAKSTTPEVRGDDLSLFGKITWDNDFLTIGTGHLTVQPNFNPELGFVQREDIRKTIGDFAVKPRPGIRSVRQLILRAFLEYFADNENRVKLKNNHYTLDVIFERGDLIRVAVHDKFERVDRPFRIAPSVVVPPGIYKGGNINIEYNLDPSKRITGAPIIEYLGEWGFFGGKRNTVRLNPFIKFSERLSIDARYEINRVTLPFGNFTAHVLNARVNYSFSKKLLTSTTIQYNSTSNNLIGLNFRLNYIYRPNDDFFFIYNQAQNLSEGIGQGLINRSVMVKLTHSFDF